MFGHCTRTIATVLILTAGLCRLAVGQTREADPKGVAVEAAKLRPVWAVGDQWTVETSSVQQQTAVGAVGKTRGQAVRWQFLVKSVEAVDGRQCFRVKITSRAAGRRQPLTTLWIDRDAFLLRQFQTQFPVPGGFRTVTETYRFREGSKAPVLPPLTALPVDLPVFDSEHSKSLEPYSYETLIGDANTKNLDTVRFATDVRQQLVPANTDGIKSLLNDEFTKSLDASPVVELRLQSPDRTVRQFWQAGQPWPLLADNGVTRARLLNVTHNVGAAQSPATAPATNESPADSSGDKALDSGTGEEGAGSSRTGVDEGQAGYTPWSGYWWPLREGRMLHPLTKYDRLTGRAAADWERKHHPATPDTPEWFGYCHAWAASAVMETEPVKIRQHGSSGDPIHLSIGDQKGLLAACHACDVANSYGDRFGDGEGSEDRQDLGPDQLWRLLKTYLQQQGVPLILDVESGPEIWNFPVYSYRVNFRPSHGSGQQQAELELLMADDAVPPDYRGVRVRRQTYRFSYQTRDGAIVAGSGRWVGRSREDHPDFAWYPYVAVAENPEVLYASVQKLVFGGTDTERPDTTTPPSTTPAETTPPTESSTPTEPAPSTAPEPSVTAVTGQQQPVVVSPIELVALVSNKTSSFAFDATVDRFDGAIYEIGSRFNVRCSSERAGYLYLVQINAAGTPAILFPLPGDDNRLPADRTIGIPTGSESLGFPVRGPQGTTRIKAIVTERPLLFSGTALSPRQQQRSRPNDNLEDQHAKSPEPIQFRFHPTQRKQVEASLREQPSELLNEILSTTDPVEFVGAFAQDEIAFYVDKPRDEPPQKRRQQEKRTPQPPEGEQPAQQR